LLTPSCRKKASDLISSSSKHCASFESNHCSHTRIIRRKRFRTNVFSWRAECAWSGLQLEIERRTLLFDHRVQALETNIVCKKKLKYSLSDIRYFYKSKNSAKHETKRNVLGWYRFFVQFCYKWLYTITHICTNYQIVIQLYCTPEAFFWKFFSINLNFTERCSKSCKRTITAGTIFYRI